MRPQRGAAGGRVDDAAALIAAGGAVDGECPGARVAGSRSIRSAGRGLGSFAGCGMPSPVTLRGDPELKAEPVSP